jgi:hypothetical protein
MQTQQIQTFQPCDFGNGWGEFVDIENYRPVNKNKLPPSINILHGTFNYYNRPNQTNQSANFNPPNQEPHQKAATQDIPSQIEKIHMNQNYMFNLITISIITIVGYCMPIRLKTITNVMEY